MITILGLIPHEEGGYFKPTYRSSISTSDDRPLLSSIYYMLTDDSPIGYLHKNKSDIVHFHHAGSSATYLIIDESGKLEEVTLGPDISNGQQLQLTVKGGCWKSSRLDGGEYCLISEVVTPGFVEQDRVIADSEKMKKLFPDLWEKISPYIKPNSLNLTLHS